MNYFYDLPDDLKNKILERKQQLERLDELKKMEEECDKLFDKIKEGDKELERLAGAEATIEYIALYELLDDMETTYWNEWDKIMDERIEIEVKIKYDDYVSCDEDPWWLAVPSVVDKQLYYPYKKKKKVVKKKIPNNP